jgi:RNA-directed DNA polymerase
MAAGERVMESVTRFLEEKLRLRVNRDKSAVAPVGERKFLGHRLLLNGKLGISPKSVERAKDKIRQITRRTRGVSLLQVLVELNSFLIGWVTYYRYAACGFELQCLDEWVRRRLRAYRLKQRKRGRSIGALLRSLGVSARSASKVGRSGKGPWRLANCPPVARALSNSWFHTQGLVSLADKHAALKH